MDQTPSNKMLSPRQIRPLPRPTEVCTSEVAEKMEELWQKGRQMLSQAVGRTWNSSSGALNMVLDEHVAELNQSVAAFRL